MATLSFSQKMLSEVLLCFIPLLYYILFVILCINFWICTKYYLLFLHLAWRWLQQEITRWAYYATWPSVLEFLKNLKNTGAIIKYQKHWSPIILIASLVARDIKSIREERKRERERLLARFARREVDSRPIERQTTMNDYITLATAATLELVERVLLRSLVLTHLRPIPTTGHASLKRQQSDRETRAIDTSLPSPPTRNLESSSAIRHIILASFVPRFFQFNPCETHT